MIKDTEEVLKQLIKGDDSVIYKLYKDVFPKIKSYVFKNKGNREDAEDVFQKVLMQVIARYKTKPFVLHTSFDGFIYMAAMNLWRRELNKRKKVITKDSFFELDNGDDDIVLSSFEQEKWEFFQEKLQEISEKCRELLQFFFKKVPYKVIMNRLGYKSDNVVRQRIFNCKSQLTKSIQNDNRFNQFKEI